MTAYRDQYASLFNGGRNVVLVGISNDPVDELTSWLHDADFPFLFASDRENEGATYAAQTSLETDGSLEPVEHPLLDAFFSEFTGEEYVRNDRPWPAKWPES